MPGACSSTRLSIAGPNLPVGYSASALVEDDIFNHEHTSRFTVRSSARTWSNPDIGARKMIASTRVNMRKGNRTNYIFNVPSSKNGTQVAKGYVVKKSPQ